MRLLAIAVVISLWLAACSSPEANPSTLNLFEPRPEEVKLPDSILKSALTIFLKNDSEFVVTGTNGTGRPEKMTLQQVQDLVKTEGLSDTNRFIILKSSKKVTYRAMVDMLDQMTINGIERYRLVDLEEKELSKLETDYQLH